MYILEDLIKKREFNKNTDKILSCLEDIKKYVEQSQFNGYRKYYQNVLSKVLNYALKQNNELVVDYCLKDLKDIKPFHLKSVVYSKNINLIKKMYGIAESRYYGVSTSIINSALDLMIKKRMEKEIILFLEFLRGKIVFIYQDVIKSISKKIISNKMDNLLNYIYVNDLYSRESILIKSLIEKLKLNIDYLRENNLVNSKLINDILSGYLSMNISVEESFVKSLVLGYRNDFELDNEVLKRYILSSKIENSILFNNDFVKNIEKEFKNLCEKEMTRKKQNEKVMIKLEKILLMLEMENF